MHRRHAAFTLVELSIVLVILGLLVGGVMTGASLMKAAKLRSVTSEANNFQTAIDTFYEKYDSLPGDMPNAIKFWGAADGGSIDTIGADMGCFAVTTPAAGTETCNGNGSGLIGDIDAAENYRAWQHLTNAGLVAGSYAGVGVSGFNAKVGYNVPASAKAPGGWQVMGYGKLNTGDTAGIFDADYGNVLQFGASTHGTAELYGAILRPDEAHSIDSKLDDGKPGLGRILTAKTDVSPDCLQAGNLAYNLAFEEVACTLLFISPNRGVKHE